MKVTAANQQLIALSCLRGQGINMYVACDQITQKLIESLLCCQRSDLGLFVFFFRSFFDKYNKYMEHRHIQTRNITKQMEYYLLESKECSLNLNVLTH